MAVYKVSDAAAKAGTTTEEMIKKLNNIGLNLTSSEDTVSDEDLLLINSSSSRASLDKRQEMIKKAMERHKSGVKIKEVVLGKVSVSQPKSKITKEELARKKAELDKRLKMVDEDREKYVNDPSDNQDADQVVGVEEQEKPLEDLNTSAITTNSTATNPPVIDSTATNPPVIDSTVTITSTSTSINTDINKKVPLREPTPKTYTSPVNTFKKEYTPYTSRPSTTSSDGRNFARPYTPKKPGESLGYSPKGTKSEDTRSNTYTTNSNRPGQDRFNRTDSNTASKDSPYNKPKERSPSLSLTQDEERRRTIIKKKNEETTKDIEAKRLKAKKDAKKTKSWTKTISEGIEELNIEKEIDKPIATHIDISDLADVDPDKQRARISTPGYRSRSDKKPRRRSHVAIQNTFVKPTEITIGERVVVSDLGSIIGVKATELIRKLFNMGIMSTVNQSIDAETVQLICMEYDISVNVKTLTEEDILPVIIDSESDLFNRPPIVTVMGHVDHGKTSLLDAIRSTSVVEGEAGGITQHIGAYEVESSSGKITFLDTPGHEAFTTLRARGALLTDIVILVVAADDGVKPQTKEAIDHAKAAGVRIVVAINKIDKEGANSDKVRQQLAEHGIISDEWGGEYQFQEISAKKQIGISDLLERVLLEADVLDLKGNPNRTADGVVIESRLDKQKGPVATILIKNGTLKKGDTFISGDQFGKVRAMFNFKGATIKEASVSMPCEIMGFSEVPQAGERFISVDEKTAKQVAELRALTLKEKKQTDIGKLTLADFFSKTEAGELKELNIILKADAQGSVEALVSSLKKLSNLEVKVNIIHDGIGGITESDVSLAIASRAIIIGFNVRPDNNAKSLSDKEKIDIQLYSIIYKAIDDIKLALEGMLSPDIKEVISGKVEIRQLFSVPKLGKIAGSFVLEGKVTRSSNVRVIRDSIVLFDGKIGTLRRFTDDVREVAAGYECGLSIDKYQDIKIGDIIEVYELTEEKRTLADVERAEQLEKSNAAKDDIINAVSSDS